jgi:type IV pilus assembly protein PilM
MVNWFATRRHNPIGIEFGSRSVQMLQFSADRRRVLEAVRWDLPRDLADKTPEARSAVLVEAVRQARHGRKFRGRDAVVGLSSRELYVQNIRVPKAPAAELTRLIQQEAAARLPFPISEAELRYLSAGEVRQGEQTKREIILLAGHRPIIDQMLGVIDQVGFRAIAVDVEPVALVRAYTRQYRREEDKGQRVAFVRMGSSNTGVVIAQGQEVFFVKYIDVGGDHLDDAVAAHLKITPDEAAALRRPPGDRRTDRQDPEVVNSVVEATRPLIEKLANELALCIRYHSVTFRGQAIRRLVLGGTEAVAGLAETLASRLNIECDLGDPLRSFDPPLPTRRAQWDIAAGLALRDAADPT